jgi:Fe2+ or Zn2+ uptake regulation protein
MGLIHKVNPLYDTARYETQTHLHHHLICVRCKKIIDIDEKELTKLEIPSDFHNFDVLNYQVQITGICENCKN